jgi:hypothetical protein
VEASEIRHYRMSTVVWKPTLGHRCLRTVVWALLYGLATVVNSLARRVDRQQCCLTMDARGAGEKEGVLEK